MSEIGEDQARGQERAGLSRIPTSRDDPLWQPGSDVVGSHVEMRGTIETIPLELVWEVSQAQPDDEHPGSVPAKPIRRGAHDNKKRALRSQSGDARPLSHILFPIGVALAGVGLVLGLLGLRDSATVDKLRTQTRQAQEKTTELSSKRAEIEASSAPGASASPDAESSSDWVARRGQLDAVVIALGEVRDAARAAGQAADEADAATAGGNRASSKARKQKKKAADEAITAEKTALARLTDAVAVLNRPPEPAEGGSP